MKKNVLIGTILLSIAFFCALFNIDLSPYLEKINANFIDDVNFKTEISSSSEKENIEFVKCVDGDTATFKIQGKNKKVRFLAIDTPESVHPYKEIEEYGKNASEYTCNILKNANTLELSYENNLSKTDKYGRILAWVWADNELVQEKLLSVGYAKIKYIYANNSKLDLLYKIQKQAQEKKIGIWYDYQKKEYNDKTYTVTFKVANEEKKVTVKEGNIIDLIDNPSKAGYVFSGWTYSNQPYDFSNPITRNITVKAKFSKK